MSCLIDKYFKRNIDYKISDMAHYCGVSPQAIYLILDNKRSPNIYLAMKMAQYLTLIDNCWQNVDDLWCFDQCEIAFKDDS